MTNSEAIAVILQRICTSLLQCHGSHPPKARSQLSLGRSVPREIPSRRLALEPLADHVEVALDRGGKVGACLTDLARGKRMFGIVGHSPTMPAFG